MTEEHPRSVGLLTADPSRALVRAAIDAGIDFLVVDAEQTGLRSLECLPVAETLRGTSTRLCIRVPDLAPSTLVEYANTGASELVLPQLGTVDELRAAHAAVRYEPEGRRSRQPSFASSLGLSFDGTPRLTVLFETVSALENIEEIVSDPCFDGGWVGPTDLGADLRRAGSSLDVETAVDMIVRAVTAAGHRIGLPAASADGVQAAFARGATDCAVYWERRLTAVLAELTARQAYAGDLEGSAR